MKPTAKIKLPKKALTSLINLGSKRKRIIKFLCHQSKNIYNHYIFCYNVYQKFKENVYLELLKSNDPKPIDFIIDKLSLYYEKYSNNFDKFKNNNTLIYNYIRSLNLNIDHKNLDKIKSELYLKCIIKIKELNVNLNDPFECEYLYENIIDQIIHKNYLGKFYYIKRCILNHKPIENPNQGFIEHVKKGDVIKREFNNKWVLDHLYNKSKKKQLSSETTLIRTFALKMLKDRKIYGDIIINIMDKVQSTITAHYAKLAKGMYSIFPKYKSKNETFVIPFFSRSFRYEKIKDKHYIKLSIGDYASSNINEICKSNFTQLKSKRGQLYYNVNNKPINMSYIYVKLPKILIDKKIKLIEIVPIYNDYKFKINFIYDDCTNKLFIEPSKIDDMISIDLGIVNLMTIYDPSSTQKIIRGSLITSLNHYYAKKIDEEKSIQNKETNKIRLIRIKRENKLNNTMNRVVSKLYQMYNNKMLIIGLNQDWKTNVNMGKTNNRTFYEIPYKRLINKLINKFGKNRIYTTEESYTSKCDALNFEQICKHEQYTGKRIERGLFSSQKGKLINADLNGAINIMRKYCKIKGIKMNEIKGKDICNPTIIQI